MMPQYHKGNYFYDGAHTSISTGQPSKIEDKYYCVHDKLMCDYIDMDSGQFYVDKMAYARACYGQSEWYWGTDEAWTFYTTSRDFYSSFTALSSKEDRADIFILGFQVLKSTAVNDMNGDVDENDPFFAFEAPTLTPGVSDQMGPSYMDTRTALSSLTLKAASYTYTGKAIKPKFTVKAGKKTVPASGYTVSYEANKNVGMGRITVKAKGNYAGSISSSFTIVPKGTALSTVKKNKTKATVKWKKQSAKMPSSRITGYQIRYSTKQNMKGAKTVSVNGYGKTSKTIKGLKKNQKYYFQIRTYATSKKGTIYSTWSKKKAVK